MRRKLLLMSQVLGQPQEQAQLPLATAEALVGHAVKPDHGEESDFWLTGWSAACESPFPGHVEPRLGSTTITYGQI